MIKKEYIWGIRLSNLKKYGRGHISRIKSLSSHLNGSIIFFLDSEENIDLFKKKSFTIEKNKKSIDKAKMYFKQGKIKYLIIDSYHVKKKDITNVSLIGPTCVFDDYDRSWPKNIYVIKGINCNIKVNKKNKNILQGIDYVIINSQLYNSKKKILAAKKESRNKKILIQLTTHDRKGWVLKVLKALSNSIGSSSEVTVILDKSSPFYHKVENTLNSFSYGSIIQYKNNSKQVKAYKDHDIIIGSGGMAALERAYLGFKSLTFSLNLNQKKNCLYLKKLNAICYGGYLPELSQKSLIMKLNSYINKKQTTYNKKGFIDNKGAERVASKLENHLNDTNYKTV